MKKSMIVLIIVLFSFINVVRAEDETVSITREEVIEDAISYPEEEVNIYDDIIEEEVILEADLTLKDKEEETFYENNSNIIYLAVGMLFILGGAGFFLIKEKRALRDKS